MLATHLSTRWDERRSTEAFNDKFLAEMQKQGFDVVYLHAELGARNYCDDVDPDYVVYSNHGEFDFALKTNSVVLVGGLFGACQLQTVKHILGQWEGRTTDLNVKLWTKGIYTGTDLIGQQAFTQAAKDYAMKKYGADESITLAEFLSLHPDDQARLDMLTWWVNKLYDAGDRFPDHKIVVRYKDKENVFKPGKGTTPPTLTFNFSE